MKKKKKGSQILGMMFEFIIIMSITGMFMLLWKPFMIYMNLSYYTKNVVSQIEVTGDATHETINNIKTALENDYSTKYNFDFMVTPNGNFYTGGGHTTGEKLIQLRQSFTVTATCVQPIEISFMGYEPTTITRNLEYSKTVRGVSQVYHKPR